MKKFIFILFSMFYLFILSAIFPSLVFGEGIPHKPQTDIIVIGRGNANDPKQFIYDSGLGGSNPILQTDAAGTSFLFNKPLGVIGDLTIGDGTATDQKMIMDIGAGASNPFFEYNSTKGKLGFSHNGSPAKVFGTGAGGGGGQNFFVDNFDAESGTSNWTNIGSGTFVTFTGGHINGDNSFRWDAAIQNDILRTDQIVIPEKFKGRSCQIEFTFKGGTSDLVKPQVVDSSNVKLSGATFRNQIDNSDFLQAQTNIVTRSIYFICPSSGTIAFEFNQTAAGDPAIMDFDDVYIGELKGLVDTVLPDLFSVRVENTGGTPSTISENIAGWVDSYTDNGVGLMDVNLKAGTFTVLPACVCTHGENHLSCMAKVVSTTLVNITTRGVGIAPVDTDFQLFCHKQGSDAKQSVQIFTSIPKVSEIVNDFHLRINAGGIISEDKFGILTGNCTLSGSSNEEKNCVYTAGIFTVEPTFTMSNCNLLEDSIQAIESVGPLTGFKVHTRTNGNSAVDRGFCVSIHKAGVDRRDEIVQPVIVGQVTNSFADGGHNIRVESCTINNNGTASIDTASTLCEGWVDSVTRVLSGKVETDITGIGFGAEPNCTCSARAFSVFCMIEAISQTLVTTRTQNDAGTTQDKNFTLSCQGVR